MKKIFAYNNNKYLPNWKEKCIWIKSINLFKSLAEFFSCFKYKLT